MKVRLRSIFAHPAHGCAGPGSLIEVDEATARQLIAGRFADAHDPLPDKIESQAMATPETAMQPRAVRKPR